MASKELQNAINGYENYIERHGISKEAVDAYIEATKWGFYKDNDKETGLLLAEKSKKYLNEFVLKITGGDIYTLEQYAQENKIRYEILDNFYEILRMESAYKVKSFFEYIEIDTEQAKRFYYPRKHTLSSILNAYQEIYDGKLDFLSVSQPKRTGKTTSGLRLSLMMGGNKPDGCIFATGKGEGLVKSFFGGINETFDDKQMYQRYLDVFPNAVKVGQNADELTIHLGKKRRFATFTCRPIDGSIVGNTEANVLLYIDDCVKNHEEARNRDRLEFLCEKVTDDVLGRRIEGTPIIIQGTKYSLYDPITHLQNKADEMGWKWKEVAIPALDPITDESNWEIKKDGKKIFTTKYYQQERVLVTEETWESEFQQSPFEAKGRMFADKELNYFEELPIDREPDAIMAACDSADKGEDSCSMPIGYVYGNEVYIVDVVFDNAGTQFTKPECANMLIKHNVKTVTFESNSAGEYFGRDVMQLVAEQGGRCSARYKFNCSNKITRMENARDNIIRDYYFRDFKKMDRSSQYYKFMKELTTMTRSGKVKHDDAPDSLALFENEMRSGTVRPTKIISSPV
jgi:predicted phage terminase large subunit-like protein